MWYRTYERWDYAPAHGTGIGGAIYLVLGVIVAAVYHYFDHLSTLGRLLSALIAVLVWPLVLLGVHIQIG